MAGSCRCVKMTPDRIAVIRALSPHWNQTEIAAWIGCAQATIGKMQRDHDMPRLSKAALRSRSATLWRRMWGQQ